MPISLQVFKVIQDLKPARKSVMPEVLISLRERQSRGMKNTKCHQVM